MVMSEDGFNTSTPTHPPTFLILSLTLLFFSIPLFSLSSLLPLLLIITLLHILFLIALLPQICTRSDRILFFSLFLGSAPFSLSTSDLSYRLLCYLDFSLTLRSRMGWVLVLIEVMMAWGFLPLMMVFYKLKFCYPKGFLDYSSISLIYSSWLRKIMMIFYISKFSYPKGFLDYSSLSSIYSSWLRKVFTALFSFITLSTTSSYSIVKGHTNSHVLRVYKYPLLVTISNQVRVDLRVTVLFLSINSQFSDLVTIVPLTLLVIFFCGMATSPRSVLDSSFQCEAAPICLEERSSSSLENALRRTLAGRLLTAKRPSIPNLTLAVSRLWNCAHRLNCYDHGKCLYSFEFTYAPDVERVVSGGPWYVNGDMLLISRMNPNQSIEQLPFSYAKLWVRCFDLPPKCFTKDYAEAIGNSLGKFCETDLPPEDPEEAMLLVQKIPTVRKYLRVKFEFNLYGPLKSTQSIKICNAKKVVVAEHVSRLTYERLPHVCFRCGFLGHLMEECSFEGPQLYGEWIRAEMFFRINFQNSDIPKAVSTSKEGQPSSSLAGNRVT